MTLLSDRSIRARMTRVQRSRRIVLENCDLNKDINPCSVTIYLGDTIKIWTGSLMDPRQDNSCHWKIHRLETDERGRPIWRLEKGEFYLGVMSQRLTLPADVAGTMVGNSSEARCGIVIHQQAGHFDPGYTGQGTFEITVEASTTILWPGMRIGQFKFELTDMEVERPYRGRYQGDVQPEPAKPPKRES
jgi:deoxycytidine triphosphate deaminase